MDKASVLGIQMQCRKWTQFEEQYLINNYNKLTISQIAKHLNKTEGAIMKRVWKLKLTTPNVWTNEDIKLLRKLYPIHSNEYLSENIFKNKKPNTIRTKALSLGLHKSKEKGLKKNIMIKI